MTATASRAKKPTDPQRRVLENLAAGLSPTHHLSGRSEFGGYTGTRACLYARGWMHEEGITAAGRIAIGLPGEEKGDLSEGAYEMLRAAVNLARSYQTRDVKTLREQLILRFPKREQDIDAAVKFWAEDIARRYPKGPPRY